MSNEHLHLDELVEFLLRQLFAHYKLQDGTEPFPEDPAARFAIMNYVTAFADETQIPSGGTTDGSRLYPAALGQQVRWDILRIMAMPYEGLSGWRDEWRADDVMPVFNPFMEAEEPDLPHDDHPNRGTV